MAKARLAVLVDRHIVGQLRGIIELTDGYEPLQGGRVISRHWYGGPAGSREQALDAARARAGQAGYTLGEQLGLDGFSTPQESETQAALI